MVQAEAFFGGCTMKEIFKITIALTIACLIAGGVMGGVFIATAKAKKRNDHLNTQQTLIGLLGYSSPRSAPSDLKLHTICRYTIEEDAGTHSGYMVPVMASGKTEYELLIVDLEGQCVSRHRLGLQSEKAMDEQDRKDAITHVLGPGPTVSHADTVTIAGMDAKRRAYVIPGKFPGYKNAIHVMVALNPDFSILGLEITAHEEDPGLGGEIEKEYFKNQFKGKAFENIKHLSVSKAPLAEEHKRYLETKEWGKRALSEGELASLGKKYQDEDIHAISGATISSNAVANGVKRLVRNFAHRMALLDRVIRENHVEAVF
jgi:electron transport complex protein RnfG